MRQLLLILVLLSPLALAEEHSPCDYDATQVNGLLADFNFLQEGVERPSPVYYGTPKPTHVPLTSGQMLAIGTFKGCSGTIIADGWVLTAKHCKLSKYNSFYVGTDPKNPNIKLEIQAVYNHRNSDLALVRLSKPTSETVPDVEPIPLFTDKLDESWIGKTVEASGYGNQETGRKGEREFTAEPVDYISGSIVAINGHGKRGVAFGDSGGPLMAIAKDGTTRVIGSLNWGDTSNVGIDRFNRIDYNREWVEGILGPLKEPKPRDESETLVINCPEGTTKYKSATHAFRDRMCSDGERYLVYHEGVWWNFKRKRNATEIQFEYPADNILKTLSFDQLAITADPGTVAEVVYPEGYSVGIPEESEPEEDEPEEVEDQPRTQTNHNHGSRGGIFRRLFGR